MDKEVKKYILENKETFKIFSTHGICTCSSCTEFLIPVFMRINIDELISTIKELEHKKLL